MTVTGLNAHVLGRTINNSGVMNFSQASLTFNSGIINNLAGATINLSGVNTSPTFGILPSAVGQLTNAGQINVSGGTSNLVLFNSGSSQLMDSGTINVPSGTLILNGGTYNTGAVITGGGFVDLVGSTSFGTVTLNDALALNGSNVNLGGGTVQGPGNLNINNVFNWNSGTLTGIGAVNIAPGAVMNLNPPASRTLSRVINNAGILNFGSTSESLTLLNGVINNQPGGVINLNGPSLPFSNSGSANLLNNDGLINVGSFQTVSVPFVDSGTISIPAGELSVATMTLEAGAFINGGGTIAFNDVGQPGALTINGTTTVAANGRLSGGNVIGSGDLILAKSFSFDSGTISGSGVVNVLPGAILNAGPTSSTRTIARTINNSGSMNFPNSGANFAGGTINNTVTGVINAGFISSSVNLQPVAGAVTTNRIVNAGTFNVLGGTLNVGIPFSNTGTLVVGGTYPAAANFTDQVSQIIGSTLLRGTWIVHNNSSLTLQHRDDHQQRRQRDVRTALPLYSDD